MTRGAGRTYLPDFRAHENSHRCEGGADSDLHGARGAWHVSRQRLRWDILDAFAEAAAEAGIARIDDFNTGDNAGVSYFDVNQRGGFRVSSAKAFLKPARSRANLTVWTHALTERLRAQPRCERRLALHGRHADPRRRTGESACVARSHPRRRAPLARHNCCSSLGSAPPHYCASTASKCSTTFAAWARICRTICRSGRCSR